MTAPAFYNEHDPYAAQWLRNLMFAGHIPKGTVDARSIEDLTHEDVAGPGPHHFFAGIGVWAHALRLAGWPDDADVWTGSCPCQPFSSSGLGLGAEDDRHLWPAWFRLIDQRRPRVVVGEQVASGDGLVWLDTVRADLEGAGYAFAAFDLAAAGAGAPHTRQRIYFAAVRVADSAGQRQHHGLPEPKEREEGNAGQPSDAAGRSLRPPVGPATFWAGAQWLDCVRDGTRRPAEPGVFPLVDGPSARVGQLRAYGNAIVGPLATAFLRCLRDTLNE